MKFSDLNLAPQILRAAEEAGYETPSPIQEKAIPPVAEGRDLLGCAQTGTGKTAAFAMPILHRLAQTKTTGKKHIRALILTPTRELALQIDESIDAYGKYLPLKHCVIFGGVGQTPQVEQLRRGVDVLTATPGRLNDLVGQKLLDLSHVEIFVLDEADRMLDMGFVHDVRRVLSVLPAKKQTLLFSATMPKEIEQLAASLLHNPAKVMVTPPSTTVEKIDQSVYFVDKGNKRFLLAHLLKTLNVRNALVFTRTKHGADRVVRELGKVKITARAIHGNKGQNARQEALSQFKDGTIKVLVATDIAARGIDVSGLSHVFNYDLPNIPETYVHRIGRTARAGQEGVAINFCNFDEQEYLADIKKLTKIEIPVVEHAWPMQIFEKAEKNTQARPPRQERNAPKAGKGKKEQANTTAKKPLPVATQGEKTMQPTEQAKQPVATTNATDEAVKKRRRRGGRRHKNKSAQENGAVQQAKPDQAQPKPEQRQPKPEQRQPRPAQRTPEPKVAKQPQKQPNRAPQERTAPKAKEPLLEVDNSLQVISRKPPVQKYANFEEYMKAHE